MTQVEWPDLDGSMQLHGKPFVWASVCFNHCNSAGGQKSPAIGCSWLSMAWVAMGVAMGAGGAWPPVPGFMDFSAFCPLTSKPSPAPLRVV